MWIGAGRDSWTLFKLLDEEGNGDINLSVPWHELGLKPQTDNYLQLSRSASCKRHSPSLLKQVHGRSTQGRARPQYAPVIAQSEAAGEFWDRLEAERSYHSFDITSCRAHKN